jgi:HD-like signal output (HDOD) protein
MAEATPETTRDAMRKRLQKMEHMPSLPVTLVPLLRYLEQPLERLEVQEVVTLISKDKSLTAQCLHLANSPLFGRWQQVDNIRSAVVALGMQRMRDIAISCSVLQLTPAAKTVLDPTVFWEHSLGCALVSRRFAKKIGFPDPGKAYLAGLLHDLGIIANLWALPQEFCTAFEHARNEHLPLHEAETSTLGLTHCESGNIVAENWGLPADLREVIACHHGVAKAVNCRGLVAIISLSDLLCRMSGLGYGFIEERQINLSEEPGVALLLQECPSLGNFDWARLTFELEGYLEEVHRLVALLYRSHE